MQVLSALGTVGMVTVKNKNKKKQVKHKSLTRGAERMKSMLVHWNCPLLLARRMCKVKFQCCEIRRGVRDQLNITACVCKRVSDKHPSQMSKVSLASSNDKTKTAARTTQFTQSDSDAQLISRVCFVGNEPPCGCELDVVSFV